jgi:hypothetical protein
VTGEASPWWRVPEAADYARVNKSQIFRACAARQLEHVRVSGRATIVTKREWVDAWLESRRVHVAPVGDQR